MPHDRSLPQSVRAAAVSVVTVTTVAWVVAWGYIIIREMEANVVTALQVLAGLTGVEAAALYLLAGWRLRQWLPVIPAVLVLPPAVAGVASGQLHNEVGDLLGYLARHVLGFLFFPGGAVAVGLLVGMTLDFLASLVRLAARLASVRDPAQK